ncbi:hypothetical protein HF324_14910 [Chitinophaga oryzae]|uniref:Glycosyltransferase RgtA/B/C/D-like domain-containing protein n=1 Tax=Chitinophaga oryzae TaxID=2725414 RepID=A0ABX6LGX8_9BACT|nr:hypothetical protein [Chitinophaga oryzae]QJB39082.1 hypothetical protein HF324_14910 [Chitinophaga oryzae]
MEGQNLSEKELNLEPSFKGFLLQSGFNRIAVAVCFFICVIQIVVFKYYYPFASFINGDSFEYVQNAFLNARLDVHPVGYSKFLRLFSIFSTNDTSLVVFQYFFVQISIWFFLFSIFYFHEINVWIKYTLLGLLTVNPIILYMANYISTDALFLALSVLWITSLLWFLHRPSWSLAIIHAFLILLVFMIRYNALYYPIVSLVAFLGAKAKNNLRIVGVLVGAFLIGGFVLATSLKYKKLTGVYQFSPFSGWQIANNGLYIYRGVLPEQRKELPEKFKELDREVRMYLDTVRTLEGRFPEIMLDINAVYMWSPASPLRTFMGKSFKKKPAMDEFQRWSSIAPLYKEYGTTLIKTYPIAFFKRFLWPNFVKFYSPPVEFLGTYGYNVDTIPAITKDWFRYRDKRVTSRFSDVSVNALDYYPIICGTMSAVFIMMSISFFILKGREQERDLFKTWLLFAVLWVCNMVFSVFASPIALRFQILSLIVSVVIVFVILDFMLKQGAKEGKKSDEEIG